ncbi:MAG: DUF4277 domain-containing protein [Deltaproteobacteria bacterium]|nr:DUF4277 domain-containing protein [Deltaproteobacteria bacterium]
MNSLNNNIDNTDNFIGIKIDSKCIISTFCKESGVIEFIDSLLLKVRPHNITHGESFIALLINGLSFNKRALYNISDEMSKMPLYEIFGRDISHSYFNDDALARSLEAISDFGPDAFFLSFSSYLTPIVLSKIPNLDKIINKITDKTVYHADTTNFCVKGEFKNAKNGSVQIVPGHSKTGQNNLNLFSLSLVKYIFGLPIYMHSFSGNGSDNKELAASIQNTMKALRANLKNPENFQKPFFIADAVFLVKIILLISLPTPN